MGIIQERKVITREKRKSTITAYYGVVDNLADIYGGGEIVQRIRTFSQSSEDELIEALRLLSTIKESAIVVHGAVGCSASLLGFDHDNGDNVSWYTTNLNERDTIMGGDSKLRSTVERAYKESNSKIIFVVGTPVVAINNDDMTSVIMELKEEIGIPIILVYTDGFKSRSAVNGIDIALHGLVKYVNELEVEDRIVQKTGNENPLLNVVSITESKETINDVSQLLDHVGVAVNVIPRFRTIEHLRDSLQAAATVALNEDEADILMQGLSEGGVPNIHTKAPIGVKSTAKWLSKIGKQLGVEHKIVEFIHQEELRIQGYIVKQPLKGMQYYVDLPARLTEGVIDVIEELGGELVGVTVPYIDEDNIEFIRKQKKDLKVQVGDNQVFELANLFKKYDNVYYITNKNRDSFAIRQGITPVSIADKNIFFYNGIKNLVKSILRATKGNVYAEIICANAEKTYQEAWLRKSTNWYIKQEVK